jgi:hypothetical protein
MRRAALVLTIFVCLLPRSLEAGTVTLAWDPNTEPDIAGYLLSYGTASGSYTTTIDVGNVTSYLFSEPNPSVRYYLALRAYNTGGATSGYSNEVATTPNPPLTVTGISSNRLSPQPIGTSIIFSAIASGGTPPYQFKWWIDNGGSSTVGQQWSTSSTFTWTPTLAGSGYSIRVWARNAGSTADAADNPAAILSTSFAITTATTSSTWTFCAGQGGFCAFAGTKEVRYGANGSYYYKTLSGGTDCKTSVFGNPAPGEKKACDIRSTSTIATAPNFEGVMVSVSPSGSDTNVGSQGSPVRTIQRALALAGLSNGNGQATRVLIAAGIYRESVGLESGTQHTNAVMIIEGAPGSVLTGADLWALGWTRLGTTPGRIRGPTGGEQS